MNPVGGTGVRLRQLNLELLRDALRELPEGATMQTLAQITGLSLATCGTLLARLVKSGEAVELDRAVSGGGRPALLYGINRELAVSGLLRVEISDGIGVLTGGAANTAGMPIYREVMHTGIVEPEQVVDGLTRLVRRFPHLRAAAIALPGAASGELPDGYGKRLAELLQKRFAFPIVPGSDVNFAVQGHIGEFPALRDGAIAWLHFPGGGFPRAGIAVNGIPLRGNSGFVGEVSHLPLGISRGQQTLRLQNRSGLIGQIAETVAALAAVLNPRQIVLSGKWIDPSMEQPLRRQCGELIPSAHLPELLIRDEIQEPCLRGMAIAALVATAPPVRLIEQRPPVL